MGTKTQPGQGGGSPSPPQAKDKTKPELVFSHTNNHLKSPMCDVILDLVPNTFGLELIYNP
jgi:hypothetical protein